MIEYRQGNLLACDAEAIVNTVNCAGVMGRGIALQFKKNFPENNDYYEAACKRNEVIPGKMLVYDTNSLFNPQFIINFPTKRHWRGASRIGDIEAGLVDLMGVIQARNISTIAVPPLGCGLGGLDWGAVKNLMESTFKKADNVSFIIYEPNGAPPALEMAKSRTVPKMTNGRAALITLMGRYLDGLLDPFITLIEIHKLMYFLQESGEPLRLKYVKDYYGPYAMNLSHALNAIEGYMLIGYADCGDNPDKQIKIIPGAEKEARHFLRQRTETVQRINRVADLIDGFETAFGMELLSTVHWVAKNDASTPTEVIESTYSWGQQKQKFSQRQIILAYDCLLKKGWIGKTVVD